MSVMTFHTPGHEKAFPSRLCRLRGLAPYFSNDMAFQRESVLGHLSCLFSGIPCDWRPMSEATKIS